MCERERIYNSITFLSEEDDLPRELSPHWVNCAKYRVIVVVLDRLQFCFAYTWNVENFLMDFIHSVSVPYFLAMENAKEP